MKLLFGLLIAVALFASSSVDAALERPVGRLVHKPIAEASGIVASRQYPGIFWVHNDSGNDATIYAVRRDGTLVGEFPVEAPNLDWEDIAADDLGHLYIGDIGNNGNRIPLRCVYRVDEPNPNKKPEGKLKVTLTTYYCFPESGRFDAESLFIEGKTGYLISKRRDGKLAEIYAIPIQPPASFLKPAVPQKICTLADFVEPATGADLSRDGQLLAVCSVRKARIYIRTGPFTWTKVATIKDIGEGIEAICWDGFDLLLASENREMYRITERAWRSQAKDR